MSERDLISEVPKTFLGLSEKENIIFSPSLAGELYTGPPETLEARTAIATLTGLVHAAYRAKNAADLALSWRNYNVGASAVMCNFEKGYIGYLDGYNVKPSPGDSEINLHAEQVAIAKGRMRGLNRVMGIAVFADPDNDDANPLGTETLRPCGRCTEMFQVTPEVDERTLVLGTNLNFTKCELYTVGALQKAQTEDNKLIHDKLVSDPFPLAAEEDFDYYDRCLKPHLTMAVFALYGIDPSNLYAPQK